MTRPLTLTLLTLIAFSGATMAQAHPTTPRSDVYRNDIPRGAEMRSKAASLTLEDTTEQKPKSPRPKPKPGPPDGGEEE